MRPRGLDDVVQPPETQGSGLLGIGLHTSEGDLDAGLVADHPGVDELGHGDGHDDDPAHRRVVEGDVGIPRDDVELLRLRGDTVRSLDGSAGSGGRRRAELVCDESARIGAELSMSRERVRPIQPQAPVARSRQREVAGLRSAARRAPT